MTTEPQMEMLEEIAHRLVEQVYATQVPTRFSLYSDILAALRNERDRCAKVAETAFEEFQTGYNAGKWIAAAIREGKVNNGK